MYLLLLAVIYLAFISLGLPDSLLGSAWPTLHVAFDVPISYMGFISMIISGGTILSSLLTDRVTKKFSAGIVTAFSVLLTAVALFGFSSATAFYQLCLWGIPYGLGAGAIDASLNNYVALHYSSRHMSWLHCFWGVGTVISPYIMSYALTHSVWSEGYRTVSYIQLVIFIMLALALPLWRKMPKKSAEERGVKPLGIIGTFKTKGVPQVLLAFTAYCSAEATAMLWASSYLEVKIGLGKEMAAAFGSLFFIGMTVGRFLAGFIADRLGDRRLIRYGAYTSFVGVLLIAIPIEAAAICGFVIFGLGCAPIYPSIIHSTPLTFGEEKSQGIIGVQMASAYFGSTFMPPIFGLIANHVSISLMPLYLGMFMVLMLIAISKGQGIAENSSVFTKNRDCS